MPKPGAWGQARMPPSSSGPFPASGQWPNAVNPIFKVQNTVHVLARDPQWFVSRCQPTGLPLGLCCLQLILSTSAKSSLQNSAVHTPWDRSSAGPRLRPRVCMAGLPASAPAASSSPMSFALLWTPG